MSAAKEREAFYDAALACTDQVSVNKTNFDTEVTIHGVPNSRGFRIKRVSLGIIANSAITATDPFTIVVGGSPAGGGGRIPLASFGTSVAIREGAVVNFDVAEGTLNHAGASNDVVLSISGGSISSGDFTIKGGIYGEFV